MIYCVNPTCPEPQNLDTAKTCRCCGSFLHLHDRYLPQSLLATGNSGRTFLAIDRGSAGNTTNLCVIKQTLAEQSDRKLIQQKVQSLKAVSRDSHLPRLIDTFWAENRFYLVHEWFEGKNLATELTEVGTLDEAGIWKLLNEILPALRLLHEHKLVHQDIKPTNIIRRSNESLVLVDLGSAELISEHSSEHFLDAVSPVGSPEYAAPEQIRGKAGFASDLYSLGVTCLHLLTAQSPFDLFDSSLDRWIWQDYLTQPVSDALVQVLDRLTQRSTAQRFASVQEAIDTIQTFQDKAFFSPLKPVPPSLTPWLRFPVRHTASINAVAFHPHLAVIASASDDKTIRFWDRNTGSSLTVLPGHQSSVRSIAFSPTDPALIASASDDKTIRLWNWQTETMVVQLQGHQASVRSIIFSPDGKRLISGSWDKTIGIWSVETAARVAAAKHSLQVNAVTVSPNGTWLASASADRTSRLWQLQTTETGLTIALRSILSSHTWAVSAVAFSPDGRLLATGSNDNTVKLWQVQTGELLRTLAGHSWSIAAVQFSPDGQQLLSGSWDQTIKVWEVETGAELATLAGPTDAIHAIALIEDSTGQAIDRTEPVNPLSQVSWVASGGRDKQINLWQI